MEALRVDGAAAVEVGVRPGLEQQLEALQVVVGGADVQWADHQGGEAPGERGPDVRGHVVVDVHVGPIPTGETRGQSGERRQSTDSTAPWGRPDPGSTGEPPAVTTQGETVVRSLNSRKIPERILSQL